VLKIFPKRDCRLGENETMRQNINYTNNSVKNISKKFFDYQRQSDKILTIKITVLKQIYIKRTNEQYINYTNIVQTTIQEQ